MAAVDPPWFGTPAGQSPNAPDSAERLPRADQLTADETQRELASGAKDPEQRQADSGCSHH